MWQPVCQPAIMLLCNLLDVCDGHAASTPVKREIASQTSVCQSAKFMLLRLEVFIHIPLLCWLLNFTLPPSKGTKNEIRPQCKRTFLTHTPFYILHPRQVFAQYYWGWYQKTVALRKKICKCFFYIDKSANNNASERWSENLVLPHRLSRKKKTRKLWRRVGIIFHHWRALTGKKWCAEPWLGEYKSVGFSGHITYTRSANTQISQQMFIFVFEEQHQERMVPRGKKNIIRSRTNWFSVRLITVLRFNLNCDVFYPQFKHGTRNLFGADRDFTFALKIVSKVKLSMIKLEPLSGRARFHLRAHKAFFIIPRSYVNGTGKMIIILHARNCWRETFKEFVNGMAKGLARYFVHMGNGGACGSQFFLPSARPCVKVTFSLHKERAPRTFPFAFTTTFQ